MNGSGIAGTCLHWLNILDAVLSPRNACTKDTWQLNPLQQFFLVVMMRCDG